jgi:hypothetical protein
MKDDIMQIRLSELRAIIAIEVRNIVEAHDVEDDTTGSFSEFEKALNAKLNGDLPFDKAHKAMMKVFYTLSPADKRKAKALLKRSAKRTDDD